MKTKRKVLETIIKEQGCHSINCDDCAYSFKQCEYMKPLHDKLMRIGAMALLRMFPEKRELDPNKVLTCVTADKAKIGMQGYFADSLDYLKREFAVNHIHTLHRIREENYSERFTDQDADWALFYPIEEVEE